MNSVDARDICIVMADITLAISSAIEVLTEAIQAEGDAKDSLIVAAQALVSTSGLLADRTARAMGPGREGFKENDRWLNSPAACDALKRLERHS